MNVLIETKEDDNQLILDDGYLNNEEDVKSEDLESDWDNWENCRSERWTSVGATDSDKDQSTCGPVEDSYDIVEMEKMRADQEQLTSALLALTTHFAQVQFRVQQIVSAPQEKRELLIKDLEEFTFRGIPSIVTERLVTNISENETVSNDIKDKMKLQRKKQSDLIQQLKSQLEDLETYAYETGEAGLPQNVLLERHKHVVEQLRDRLNLNIDYLEKLKDDEELKFQVDQAISELVSPMKMKEQLVDQLKTQIQDLERFIEYLHFEGNNGNTINGKCSCTYTKHSTSKIENIEHEEEVRDRTIQMMKKALTLIQMFAVAQFGCSSSAFHMNDLKKNGNHWGDLRANLELAINKVENLGRQCDIPPDSDYTSDCDEDSMTTVYCNQLITAAVRKDLAPALADLIQHGLHHTGQSQSMVPFLSCFPNRSAGRNGSGFLTAWDLILKFYQLKNGEKYNATPARKLSQSFGLEIVGSTAITNKQMLLSAIDNIISTHTKYKRSPESHFKAFICAALNSKRLVTWLRLILRCQALTDQYYHPWSYVNKTGFEDSFRSLEKLSSIEFNLPVDLAVRQFQNIKDAFQ